MNNNHRVDVTNDNQKLDVTAVLRTVLYLLEQTDYSGKGSNAVSELKSCMRQAITDIESETRGKPN
jgi:hypothetical protein